jgi:hypothetical protein
MSGRAKTRPARRGGSRPRADWGAARTYFVRDPQVSYRDVAARFSVSQTSVRKHAHARCLCCPTPWEELRADALAVVEKRRRQAEIRSLEEREADIVRVQEALLSVALRENADITLELAIKRLPEYAKLARLFEGEATDRIESGDVQHALQETMDVAVRAQAGEYETLEDMLAEWERRMGAIALGNPREQEVAA